MGIEKEGERKLKGEREGGGAVVSTQGFSGMH